MAYGRLTRMGAPTPQNETARLRTLRAYGVLDTAAEQAYDDIVNIASHICHTPISLVSLVDADRQWFKARHGLDADQTPREHAFCAHAILDPGALMEVPDATSDQRFANNPLVTGDPNIRFYAGVPLVAPDGAALGTLCVIDREPRKLTTEQSNTLRALARQVISQLELHRTATDLAAKNVALQEFSSIVSHDLQEPLRTVANFSKILEEDYGDKLEDDGRTALNFIGDAATRMSQMIRDLLQHGRLGQESATQEVDSGQLVNDVLQDLSTSIQEHGAQISMGDLPVLMGQPTELRLLFQNLISNAIKFSGQDSQPEVRISAERELHGWRFSVSDNGIGIADGHRERIFDIFQRLHSREEYPGSGIGLTHCRKIVELHGGTIHVDSELDRGSRFVFTIPDLPEHICHTNA